MPEKITRNTLRLCTVFCSGTLKPLATATWVGAMGAKALRTWSSPLLRTTRKRADSGNQTSSTTASASGNRPPSSSRLCQPKAGIIFAETKPPEAMPRLKPQNMLVTSSDLRRSGVYSESKVVALGMAAPRPRPVRKRNTSSCSRLALKAEIRLNSPNRKTAVTSTPLRPKRSAMGPEPRAPNTMPISAALITGPRLARSMPQSWVSAGAMKPMAAVSRPSRKTMRKHSSTMRHW
ncbi:hypothetical protein D3C80_326610 [compost metagenome]